MTNTDKFWQDVTDVANEAINEIEDVLNKQKDKKISYKGLVGELRTNYLFINDDYSEVWVNYNMGEEMPLRECTINEILNAHETLSYEFE